MVRSVWTAGAVLARRFDLVCVGVALFSLWMRTGFPVSVIGDAWFDDALFVRLAASLGAGHWLGPFDDLTLVKGMFYPLFVFAAFAAGVPLKIAEQAVYLGVSYVTARTVRHGLGGGSRLPAVLFVVLALDPVLWTSDLSRVIREGLYVSQTPLLVVLTTGLGLQASAARLSGHGRALALSLATGLAAASFWLTREEGPWIVPALAVGVGAAGLSNLRAARAEGARIGAAFVGLLRRGALSWGVAAASFGAVILAVATINDLRYGAFETTEVQSYPFRRAYAALADIEQNAWRRYVVFPRDARGRAYAVSPAARELAPSLDGAIGDSWRRGGCSRSGQADCPEILAGWFQWALRDAVAAAGHYGSAAASAAYYRQLAAEIEAACARGELHHCPSPRATLAPAFRWAYVRDALHEAPAIGRLLLGFGSGSIGSIPSTGTGDEIRWFSDLVGSVEPPLSLPDAMTGWLTASGSIPTLRVQPRPDEPASKPVEAHPASDLAAMFPGLNSLRFAFGTAALDRDGRLVVDVPGGGGFDLSVGSLASGSEIGRNDVTLHVDEGAAPSWSTPTRRRELAIRRLAEGVAAVYAALAMPATVLAGVGVALSLTWGRGRPLGLPLCLALASGTGVVSRIGLLSYLDVAAIPSANVLYLSPAAPLLLIFIGLGCFLGLDALRHRRASARAGREAPV